MTANPPCAWPRFGKTSRVCETFKPSDAKRFEAALRRFDAENARDPNREMANDISHPRELLYAQRLTDWVLRLCPDASEELRLAARCQHICRWEIPRNSYPMTRPGYLQWRADLKKFHAQKAGGILLEAGYDETAVRRVQELNLKKNFPDDPETPRVLESMLLLSRDRNRLIEQIKQDKGVLDRELIDIERINKENIQRELKMIELKRKIAELKEAKDRS